MSVHAQQDARREREKRQNDLRLLLDAFEKDVGARQPKYGEQLKKRARDEVQKPLEAFFAKLEIIRTSGRYTGEGEIAEIRLAAQAMYEHLATLRAKTVAELEKQLSEQRAKALERKPSTDPTAALLREMRHRELRDHLRGIDPLQLKVRIRQAVSEGASTDLLDALEGAPVGFPIAPPDLVQEARVAIAERDHPELGELASLKQSYEYLLGTATQALKAAVGDDASAVPLVETRAAFTLSGTALPEAKQ